MISLKQLNLRKATGNAWIFLSFGLLFSLNACQQAVEESPVAEEDSRLHDYPIQPVDIRHVKLTDAFWLPIVQRVQEKTIEFALEKCTEEGRFENFLIAGGEMEGDVRGYMPFDDTDVYKIIEGASNSLISSPNEELQVLLDSLIRIIEIGQEDDGYLTTWRTIDPAKPPAEWVKVVDGKRWESLEMSHELYNAGHLFEAAAVHYQATGKRNFLDIALKNADLMVQTFGPGKIETVPGHQIIETGLIKLYRITKNEDYLELARYFLDTRGDYSSGRSNFGPYAQDHLPVVEQDEVVGHAVRAVYMYAGMTDIAAIYQDSGYAAAVDKLWDNMVSKKMYITGGIGARHEGESFGDNYELPNATAYNETCASIGDVYWNHRLFMLYGDHKYYDVIERTLYNGLISGLSLDGEKFFYPNALESDGEYKFNQGACTRKSWFDCSCCPSNLIRFLPAVQGLIYAKEANDLYVNLYVGSEAEVDLNGQNVQISQTTNYPWDGKVTIQVTTSDAVDMDLKLRMPGWARGEVLPSDLYQYVNNPTASPSLAVNGEAIEYAPEAGYVSLDRKWEGTTTITIEFPLEVRQVKASELVAEDQGKVALEYGPIVYAVESIDNPGSFNAVAVGADETFQVNWDPTLLEGVNVLEAESDQGSFKAIPYYAWSNRGIGKMKVWLPAAM
ncbi:glycoside hydrolase family 127 protein [Flavilitoribacter nigricans]|uniref:Six-hairpin glycosidase n=1 Tax=Flavilitoribacter nigricans (strain ATCC 23147 / DSM 23189 / NBRC 102662 / NCIMB 1420 / SS-2) TaxID=1122177 RepID=A0A2D0NCQ1_FLAN2|nr:beta-L-arabinofuranosidase domain-containing protein [Flavilitoribacter nigricans]PHN06257.1 six-hairpin glycosidase [Flavilitoribacter nigricans DSM 23189 = NBRC 102662]